MAEPKRHMDVLERVLDRSPHRCLAPMADMTKLPYKFKAEKGTYE